MRAAVIERHSPNPLAAPEGWNEERDGKCTALFVRPEEIDGTHFLRSAWEADPSEAIQLLGGGKMILGISGYQHPVVHLCVDQVPEDFAPVVTARQYTTLQNVPAVHVEMMFSTTDGARIGRVDVGLVDEQGHPVPLGVAIAQGVGEIGLLAEREGWVS